jgi:predicted dehydrogenase
VTVLRAGLSGCTAAAATLLRATRAHDHCRIVAVHDDDAERARAFAAEHRIGAATASVDELLGSGVDFLVHTGPLDRREELVAQAAAQGVPCLLQAPFAGDLATAEAMLRQANAAGQRLGVLLPEFADPLWDQIRRMIAADWLGAVVAVQAIVGIDDGLRGGPAGPHPFFGLLSAPLHLVGWLVGRPATHVVAQCVQGFRGEDAGGAACAVLRGGIVCTFACSHTTAANAFAVHGTDGGIRVDGDRIWLRGRMPFRGAVFDYPQAGRELPLPQSVLQPARQALTSEQEPVGRFARWIEDCDDYPCPAEQALADLRVLDAMVRAASSGRLEPTGL